MSKLKLLGFAVVGLFVLFSIIGLTLTVSAPSHPAPAVVTVLETVPAIVVVHETVPVLQTVVFEVTPQPTATVTPPALLPGTCPVEALRGYRFYEAPGDEMQWLGTFEDAKLLQAYFRKTFNGKVWVMVAGRGEEKLRTLWVLQNTLMYASRQDEQCVNDLPDYG
jgi:hypothetical protein